MSSTATATMAMVWSSRRSITGRSRYQASTNGPNTAIPAASASHQVMKVIGQSLVGVTPTSQNVALPIAAPSIALTSDATSRKTTASVARSKGCQRPVKRRISAAASSASMTPSVPPPALPISAATRPVPGAQSSGAPLQKLPSQIAGQTDGPSSNTEATAIPDGG